MIDLEKYPDDAVVSTTEVATWLGMSVKSVRRLPNLAPLKIPTREYCYYARDVKRAIRGELGRAIPFRKAS